MDTTLVLFSGGIDSSTLALHLKQAGCKPTLFTLDTGSTETQYATAFAKRHGFPHVIIDGTTTAQQMTASGRMYVGGSMNDCGGDDDGFIPLDYAVLYLHTLAAMYAINNGFTEIAWALHADDCHPSEDIEGIDERRYISALNTFLSFGGGITLTAPFLDHTKADIIAMGLSLGLSLNETYTCSTGHNDPCGTCKQCQLRERALTMVSVAV